MSGSSSNNDNNNHGDSAPQSIPEGGKPTKKKERSRMQSLLWVFVVILVGAVIGILSFLLIAPHLALSGRGLFPPFLSSDYIMQIFTLVAEHIILSTVSIALLVSLVVVYSRIYAQTKANFALGIFIVLLALLFEEVLNYPILELLTSGLPVDQLFSSPLPTLADMLTIVAYGVFLYLSLE